MQSDHIVLLFLFTALFLITAAWLYLRQRRQKELLQARMALHGRILERFDTPQQFADFLQTEGGREFLATVGDESGWEPARRVLWGVQAGIVLCFGALAFVLIAWMRGSVAMAYPAAILGCLGLGFLVSAFVSHRLSRGWGLMPEQRGEMARRLALGPESDA